MGEFQKRLKQAMDINNITQAELAQKTGLSKPRISQYVNGVYEAKQDALLKISRALHVDVAWLMGYDVPMVVEIQSDKSDSIAMQRERYELYFKYFMALNDKGKELALKYVESLAEMKDYSEKETDDEK